VKTNCFVPNIRSTYLCHVILFTTITIAQFDEKKFNTNINQCIFFLSILVVCDYLKSRSSINRAIHFGGSFYTIGRERRTTGIEGLNSVSLSIV